MSKKKLPCPTEEIQKERDRWAAWRKVNRPGKEESEPVEVLRVRQIANDLNALRWKDQPADWAPTALSLVVCDDRWELIRKATRLLEREWLSPLDPRRLYEEGQWIAFCLSHEKSLKMGKGDILEYLERVHPEIFATIPRTKNARTSWWAEVGGEQVRDGVSPEWKRKFNALIDKAICDKAAGIRAYLKPWDQIEGFSLEPDKLT